MGNAVGESLASFLAKLPKLWRPGELRHLTGSAKLSREPCSAE